MKAALLFAVALAASVNGAVIEGRQPASCGLDAFGDHTAEASLFCSSLLKTGTAIQTETYTARATTTTKKTVWTTLYPPSTEPPSTTPAPPSSTPKSTPKPSSSTPKPPSSTPPPTPVTSTPAPSSTAPCGLVGYTKTTAAYYFDSTGTKNNFTSCQAACKADTKCKSFGYGEANCMLFDISSADNVNYNPMSPYTFYDITCPKELPVRKRNPQIQISIGPGIGKPADITSACSCLITSAPADTTRTVTVTITSVRVTKTETVTRTVSILPDRR
ncbi:uncharacterized protein BDR25DRAFT_331362 [Lindgomyces ingoldianus]|uniref:Uncharacterized protein n=1 Tax=Lindgomyces ingoldianus TaxID=673940 RepID=A0ACB6RDS8_9PLEO|nr:uncharacterized protein BDR25DRAFT_331362 [Lindgomyces ingoldianus]KAF2476631.1 hypothetical protein BDR25DRAFT_331362 [Lindgomyces ingoldianus]